jgi:hypothetical protein
MARQAAASVIATEDLTVAAALQREVQRGMFRDYTHHDVVGCEIGGALKNVIAIAAGMAEGLGVGDNTRAGVMLRRVAEPTTLRYLAEGEVVRRSRGGRARSNLGHDGGRTPSRAHRPGSGRGLATPARAGETPAGGRSRNPPRRVPQAALSIATAGDSCPEHGG